MNKTNTDIVAAALLARTSDEAAAVQSKIVMAVGETYQRPLGNTWNNQGMLTASGASYDHKAVEAVTNMQDAVIEWFAVKKFGARAKAPYKTPSEAVVDLCSTMSTKELAALCTVTVDAAVKPPGKKKVTLTMRDRGCGIANSAVPDTIFRVGAGHKDGIDWQQGTFGLGGATTYRNADKVILVTRRQPELLTAGEDDRITVAVVEWERHRTTINAFYLTTSSFDIDNPAGWVGAVPFSIPAADYPDFEPGTHLALIRYGTANFNRRSGDEKSFDTVLNTRLFRPVLPIEYRNNMTRAERPETLVGLEKRFADNPGIREGSDALPINIGGVTYQIPVHYRLFAKRNEKGERRNYVAHGHALLITSNGQVHSHWSPQEFKSKTSLNKLDSRVLVVVECDALPIEIRTELFTADRVQMVRSANAARLEAEIVEFLNGWTDLVDVNKALIKEAITGDNNSRPTIAVAEKIARAFKVKGFSTSGTGKKGGKNSPPKPARPEDLYADPTHFEGPELLKAKIDSVKSVYYKLNATDGFLGAGGRAELQVTCDHPDIDDDEITVGSLTSGRVRVSIAIPDSIDLGAFELRACIPSWAKSAGGMGPSFDWASTIEFSDGTGPPPPPRKKGSKGKGGGDGALVALIWRDATAMDEWTAKTVGEIEHIDGATLASERDEYKELANVEAKIPTILLNRAYSPLKTYVQARAAVLTEEGKEQARDRYAVGVGVTLLVMDQERRKAEKKGEPFDTGAALIAQDAAARGVLSVLPEYDKLAREMED